MRIDRNENWLIIENSHKYIISNYEEGNNETS